MKKALLSFCIIVPFVQQPVIAATHAPLKSTSYLLLDRDAFDNYLDTLVSNVQTGALHTDRLVFSFLDPSMDPAHISQDIQTNNLDALIKDTGLLAANDVHAGDGVKLQKTVSDLKAAGVQVYFAVGGWAYSCNNIEKPASNCTSNFPLAPEIIQNFKTANLLVDEKMSKVQPTANYALNSYTDAWAKATKAFGGNGVDLDYEENWFVAETTFYYPQPAKASWGWGSPPNGPFTLPYSVIKYASYIQALETSSQAVGLSAGVTMAASAAGAYDVHDGIGGSMFWCPVSEWGSAICGLTDHFNDNQANMVLGGNLKGVLYDIVHYKEIGSKGYSFNYANIKDKNNNDLFANIVSRLDAINVMTYDLDDGYDAVGSSWCIGKVNNQFASRDPYTAGYENVDCSLVAQTKTITEMYKQQVINPLSGNKPHLAFGLETGFPNYPINIDPSLPGGGNAQTSWSDGHYRWNDLFVAADIPLSAAINDTNPQATADKQALLSWLSLHQTSDTLNVADIHSSALVVEPSLFTTLQTAGADSVILWSLNNADYNEHLSTSSWDYAQLSPLNAPAFANDYTRYGYDQNLLNIIFRYAASPETILQTIADYNKS